ncbi:DUF1015 domain-containing protein [archaeon]|nr:DUF1015 domain-containing protein [archaeon]
MVEILPFRGIRYSEDVDIGNVVAPPYDVISPDEARKFHTLHDKNVIRLILGEKYADDTPDNNPYTRARDYLKSWLEEGVLIRDEKPSIYILEQKYSARIAGKDENRRMLGLISLVKLEEYEKNVILPHEETLKKAIGDRLHLMGTTKTNLSQIFTMYSDPEKKVEEIIKEKIKAPPIYEVNSDGVANRFWKIDDAGVIAKVALEMKEKQLFIADGHHRYTTALMLRDQIREENGSDAYDYTMMYYTNMASGGITILPAHRLLSNVGFDISQMWEVEKYFDVEKVGETVMFEKLKAMNREHHVFGMCFGGECYFLHLKDESVMDNMANHGKSRDWKMLDVTVIHTLLIDLIVGKDHLSYIIDESEAVDKSKEEGNVVIFVNPTKLEEVKRIAQNGEKMPGKATYFYPKLLTGLVMNKI